MAATARVPGVRHQPTKTGRTKIGADVTSTTNVDYVSEYTKITM